MRIARRAYSTVRRISIYGWITSLLFLIGFAVGPLMRICSWELPYVSRPIPESVDVNAYLSAMLGGLAVFAAILAGFLAAGLPLAAANLTVKFVSHLNRGLVIYLLFWVLSACVTLVEFIHRPQAIGQLWHLLIWFVALVVMMFGQIDDMPSRLSGESMSRWAMKGLKRLPMQDWEQSEEFRAIPVGLAQASARYDLLTVRALTRDFGNFLVTDALISDSVSRASAQTDVYRTLKTLLGDSMIQMRDSSNEAAYSVGRLAAGVLIHASVTNNLRNPSSNGNTFDRISFSFGERDDLVVSFWAGARHAVFGHGEHCWIAGGSLIAKYWASHVSTDVSDPGRCQRLAAGISIFILEISRAFKDPADRERNRTQMGSTSLRFIREYLITELDGQKSELVKLLESCTRDALLDEVHPVSRHEPLVSAIEVVASHDVN